jgi:tetratricopeptide (TPR) repeat protein
MRRGTTNQLTAEVARELAIREGVGLIADGEVTRDNSGLLLTVRLVAADSGNVLATSQTSAAGVADLLPAFERLAGDLRGKMGESLKRVRSSTPLARATTASFDALLLYTLGARAYDVEGDLPKARELLLRAVELDSTFATAWRKYYIVTGYMRAPAGGWKPTRREAREAAFRHRANMSVPERLQIEGNIYWDPNLENGRPRALAAYDELARRTGRPNHNHAWFLIGLHQFARSESLFRAIVTADTMARLSYKGLMWALMNQDKLREADSVGRLVGARFGDAGLRLERILVRCGMRDFLACEADLETHARETPSPGAKVFYALAEIGLMRGQLTRWNHFVSEAVRAARGEWFQGATLARNALIDTRIRRQPRDAVARLDSMTNPVERAFQSQTYAEAGQVDSAESMLKAMATNSIGVPATHFYAPFVGPDSTLRYWGLASRRYFRASVAAARGNWRSAVEQFRASAFTEDGLPRPNCATCITLEIGRAFDRAGLTDSAIVFYEEFVTKPQYNPDASDNAAWMGFLFWKFVNEAWIHERLGELYERKGDRQNAVRHLTAFADLWTEADPELQPRVAAARSRIAGLKGS